MPEEISGTIKVEMSVLGGEGAPVPPGAGKQPPRADAPQRPPAMERPPRAGAPQRPAEVDIAKALPFGFQELTEEQRKQMQIWKAVAEKQREVLEYQKTAKAAIPLPPKERFGDFLRHLPIIGNFMKEGDKQQKTGFGALTKWLPIIGGVLGIIGLVRQSKVMSGFLEGFMQTIGALVDIFLMPFIPMLTAALKGFTGLIPQALKFSHYISQIIEDKGLWAGILEMAKTAWMEIGKWWDVTVWPFIQKTFGGLLDWMEENIPILGEIIHGMRAIVNFILSLVPSIYKTPWEEKSLLQKAGSVFFPGAVPEDAGGGFLQTISRLARESIGQPKINTVEPSLRSIQIYNNIIAGKNAVGDVEIQRVETRFGQHTFFENFVERP